MLRKKLTQIITASLLVGILTNTSFDAFACGNYNGSLTHSSYDSITVDDTVSRSVEHGVVTGTVSDSEGNPLVAKINIRKKTPGLFDILYTTTTYTDANGNFKLNIKPGKYIVTVDKGSEFELYNQDLTVVNGESYSINAQITRIIDLTSMGWYAGDQHQHSSEDKEEGKSTPREIAQGNIALGLSWSALTDHSNRDEDNTEGYWNSYKNSWDATAGLDTNLGISFLPIVGSETSATTNGHYNRLGGSHERIEQLATDREGVIRIGNDIKSLGGVAVINHPNNSFDGNIDFEYWDDEEVVNTFDAVEIWNGSFPIGIDGFLNNESIQSWYAHLNKGNKISAVAGTDAHDLFVDSISHIVNEDLSRNEEVIAYHESLQAQGSRISLTDLISKLKAWLNYGFAHGTVRTFVHADELNEENILDGIRNGNTFISNGPVILANVDGKIPGNTVAPKENNQLEVRLTSNRPLNKAVVVVDGEIYETITLDNVTDTTLNLSLDLSDAKWVAVYAQGKYPAFAHTGAIYVGEETVEAENKLLLNDILNIDGSAGTEIKLPITVSNLPADKDVRSAEMIFNIPSDLTVESVELNNSTISAENFDYNISDGKLRLALTSLSGQPLFVDTTSGNKTIGTITLKLKEDKNTGDTTSITTSNFIFRCNDNLDIEYDLTNATSTINFVKNANAQAYARELYTTDDDILPAGYKAYAIEFIATNGDVNISRNDDIKIYYSPDFTNKNGKLTYVALIEDTVSIDTLNDISKYTISSSTVELKNTVIFGDVNNDGIDAQDALATVSAWLVKTTPSNKELLSLNVNGNNSLNTRDSIDIVDKFVSNKEFGILSK